MKAIENPNLDILFHPIGRLIIYKTPYDIDVSKNTPKMLDLKMADKATAIITMGCSVEGLYPAPVLKKAANWNLKDPKGKPIEKVREIRDDVEQTVIALLKQLT